LAPYVLRIAISNRRLISLENDQVTFRYRATDTGQPKLCTLSAEAFIHRFSQHVLPCDGYIARLCQGALLRLLCSWLSQTPGCFATTARAGMPGELGGGRSYTRASRSNPRAKAVLPKLWSADAFPARYSTYGALSTMSHFGFSPLIFHWMLDFSLAPRLRFASTQK